METFHAELSVMEYNYDMALSEYQSFLDFSNTFEGDDIPDNLFEVATEVFGGGMVKSVGANIALLAKKIWEIIVKIFKWLQDFTKRIVKAIGFSNKNLRKLKAKLGSDRDRYDAGMKRITKFLPSSNDMSKLQDNLALLIDSNKDIVDSLSGGLSSNNQLTEALSALYCDLRLVDPGDSDKEYMQLFITDPKKNTTQAFDLTAYKRIVQDSITFAATDDEWKTYHLEEVIERAMTANVAMIRVPTKQILNKAELQAKKWIDEGTETQNTSMLIAARGLVQVVTDILNVQIAIAGLCNNICTRAGAYLVGGALSLGDVDLSPSKNADTGPRSAFLKFNILSKGGG